MEEAFNILDDFGVPFEAHVLSAHRAPDQMLAYARGAEERGIQLVIAGAGGAAHLPGVVAAVTTLPVLGVPIQSRALQGLDSLLSIVQMPRGVPVATFAIGGSGATNSALYAVQILALHDAGLKEKLVAYRAKRAKETGEKIK
jgi:5-(carboxyamino)imidazole ribonucleotide mutase